MLKGLEHVQDVCDIYELEWHMIGYCPTLLSFKEIHHNEASNAFSALPNLLTLHFHKHISYVHCFKY